MYESQCQVCPQPAASPPTRATAANCGGIVAQILGPRGSESTDVDSGFFKHQWWGRKTPAPAQSDFYANGHFGQRLYVSPSHRLILVRMGDNNRGIDWADFLGAVADAYPLHAESSKPEISR